MAEVLLIPTERIEGQILLIRGQKIYAGSRPCRIVRVPTKVFESSRETEHRSLFPEDFMFQLTQEEADAWLVHTISAVSRHKL